MTAARYEQVAFVAEPLVFFRAHEGSITLSGDFRLADAYHQARIWFAAHTQERWTLASTLAATWLSSMKQRRRLMSPGAIARPLFARDIGELDRMRIGIVTISYNQASYLAEAIQSVQVADPERLEYVMVDPGSTDGSREIIERHRRRFSRVILEPDHGPPDGLNKGFAATTADVVGYLNSDDRFTPGALDYVLRYFERRPDVDVLCGAIRIIDEKGEASIRRRTPGPHRPAPLRL